MENRVLGDIDYHADNPDNAPSYFDFTVEEVRMRYTDFLRLGGDNLEEPDQRDQANEDDEHDQAGAQSQAYVQTQVPAQGQTQTQTQTQTQPQAQAAVPARTEMEDPNAGPNPAPAQAQNKAAIDLTLDDNLRHEVDELNAQSIQAAFNDYNFWKPQVDMNVEELLREMNRSR